MYYQYTDINAVKSIIESHSIRLTNVKYLNDKAEFHLGLNFLLQTFNNYQFPPGVSPLCIKAIKENFIIWSGVTSNIHYLIDHLYVASFSYAPDVLSQWRGYGMYSIEFNQYMLPGRDNKKLFLLNCIYTFSDQEAMDYATKAINFIVYQITSKWNDYSDNSVLIREMIELIAVYAVTFKYPAFREESEVRLIYMNYYMDKEIDFRVRGEMLVPYVTVELLPNDITGVRIGPVQNQYLAESSLRLFCFKTMSHLKNSKLAPSDWLINVTRSEIPFTAS